MCYSQCAMLNTRLNVQDIRCKVGSDGTQNCNTSFSVRDLLLSQSQKYPTVQIYISSAFLKNKLKTKCYPACKIINISSPFYRMLKHLQMHYFPVNKHCSTEATLKKSHISRIMSLTLQN